MRHLVACSACRRQVDATGLGSGATYRCACGRDVTVPVPREHEAAVVRCSSCGASRSGGEPSCRWCGSEFTLHERDLHTLCPACVTRISDRARFCHACGVAVDPQPVGARDPTLTCPACPERTALTARTLGAVPALLECGRCLGLWLGPAELRGLLARAVETGGGEALLASLAPAPAPSPGRARRAPRPDGPLYRSCVRCGQRMNRTRFAGRTSVVVDACRDHGVWFDADELALAVREVREGRAATGPDGAPLLPGDAARAHEAALRVRRKAWREDGPLPSDRWTKADAVSTVLHLLSGLLRLLT